MLGKPLEGYGVAILATNGFEEAALVEPRKALESAGAKTTVVAPDGGTVQGMNHSEKDSRSRQTGSSAMRSRTILTGCYYL